MPDYRSMFDRDYIGVWDLAGKDRTLVIDRVSAGTLTSQGNRKTKKPIVYFRGAEKGFALNKTNAKIIAGLYGTNTDKWTGKALTLFPTTTTFGSETVECIRVRPTVPKSKRGEELKSQPVDEAVYEAQQSAAAKAAIEENQDAEPAEDAAQ